MSDFLGEGDFTLPIPLTEEEIQQRQGEYFANNKKIKAADMALNVAKGNHKGATAPLKKRNEVLDQQINDGFEMRKFRALEMVNETRGTMDYFDAEHHDVLVYSRPLTPTERMQHRIKFGTPKQEGQVF